jgi:hypothetical protein
MASCCYRAIWPQRASFRLIKQLKFILRIGGCLVLRQPLLAKLNVSLLCSMFTSFTLKHYPNLGKIWGFHGGDYEECRLLRYKNPVRTSQNTHYVSATEPSRETLCKIWGFHGGDYEECRLLRYKNPVRTSQKTHYVSTTEPSRVMLCRIRGFHGGDYEECRLLRYKNPVRTSQKTHCFRYRAQPVNAM